MLKKYALPIVSMSLYLILAIISVMFISSCASISGDTTRTLALSKASAEAIAKTAIQMNREGQLSEKDLTKIQDLYNTGQKAQLAIISSLQLSLELGTDPRTDANYLKALEHYSIVVQQLLDLAIELKLVK